MSSRNDASFDERLEERYHAGKQHAYDFTYPAACVLADTWSELETTTAAAAADLALPPDTRLARTGTRRQTLRLEAVSAGVL